jgi:hypothetical protein
MIIPTGMLKATLYDGYGREVICRINPLEVESITGFLDRTMIKLISGRNIDVIEPPDTLEKAWVNLMQQVIDDKNLGLPC